MANRPKRTDLKVVGGTDRPHRRRGKVKAPRLKRSPAPPLYLSPEAKREWSRLAPRAHQLGTLTAADLRGFELLCETLATEDDPWARQKRMEWARGYGWDRIAKDMVNLYLKVILEKEVFRND